MKQINYSLTVVKIQAFSSQIAWSPHRIRTHEYFAYQTNSIQKQTLYRLSYEFHAEQEWLILNQIYIVNFGQNKVKIGKFFNISNLNNSQKGS